MAVTTTERPVALDDLLQAAELVITAQYGSQVMVHRKLRVGHAHAEVILGELADLGILGGWGRGPDGSPVRDVLVKPDGLDAALDRIRAATARQALAADSEALDDAHGGKPVLRGGLGVAQVHAATVDAESNVEPGAEVAVRGGDVPVARVLGEIKVRPVVREYLRGRVVEIRQSVAVRTRRYGRTVWEVARQIPRLVFLLLLYAPRGLGRITAAWARYLHDYDTAELRAHHAGARETNEYDKASKRRSENLTARLMVNGTALALVVALVLAWTAPRAFGVLCAVLVFVWVVKLIPRREPGELVFAAILAGGTYFGAPYVAARIPAPPAWALWALSIGVVVLLGWIGRPRQKPLVTLSDGLLVQRLTAPMVTAALCTLGSSRMKEPDDIRLLMDVARYGQGYQIDLELPAGVPASWVIEKREELAAALRRELGTVWPAVGQRHPGHLALFVSDVPMATARQAPWPVLHSGKVNLFEPIPLFTDQRGQWVSQTLAYTAWVIGAVPRMGKTMALRIFGLVAAFDPRARLYVFDLKGTGDLSALAQVAHAYSVGDEPEDVEAQLRHMRAVREEMRKRTRLVRELTLEENPDRGKVTDALATRDPRRFGPIVVLVDECFPSGTLIGGRPIETLQAGDLVPSWDEVTGRPCIGRVVGTMRKVPESLVQVWFNDGTSLACTPNHPLMTRTGWTAAGSLDCDSEVMRYGEQQGPGDRRALLDLRTNVHAAHVQAGVLEAHGPRNLLAGLPEGVVRRPGLGPERGWEGAPVVVAASAEPDVGSRNAGQDVGNAARCGASAEDSGRQRARTDTGGAGTGGRPGLADGGHRSYGATGGWRPTDALEAGRREPGTEDRGRGRRGIARDAGQESAGRTEVRVADWRRVDSVQVLERGSDGRYGGLCPDGLVYNFEVEDTHTYLVGDGLVAHNCQVWFQEFSEPLPGDMFEPDLDGGASPRPPRDPGKAVREEFIAICRDLVKRGPALGIIPWFATQKPDAKSIPSSIADNASARLCFKVNGQISNDQILGTSSYQSGVRATQFAFSDKGIAFFRGDGADASVVRTVFGIDAEAADKLAARARAMRTATGLLTGDASGIEDAIVVLDVVADVERVLADRGLHAAHHVEIVEWLKDLRLDYAALTVDELSARLRNRGVVVSQVKRSGVNLQGVDLRKQGRDDDGPSSYLRVSK